MLRDLAETLCREIDEDAEWKDEPAHQMLLRLTSLIQRLNELAGSDDPRPKLMLWVGLRDTAGCGTYPYVGVTKEQAVAQLANQLRDEWDAIVHASHDQEVRIPPDPPENDQELVDMWFDFYRDCMDQGDWIEWFEEEVPL